MALMPNGEADVQRDELFSEHLMILEKNVVRGQLEVLDIPQRFQVGAPWHAALTELRMLNAFCSPKDKVSCIGRTCQKIVSLLRLACPDAQIGADDILPVLIYVLIHA